MYFTIKNSKLTYKILSQYYGLKIVFVSIIAPSTTKLAQLARKIISDYIKQELKTSLTLLIIVKLIKSDLAFQNGRSCYISVFVI